MMDNKYGSDSGPLRIVKSTEWKSPTTNELVASETEEIARRIVDDVKQNGRKSVAHWARELDGWDSRSPLRMDREQLVASLRAIPADMIELLNRVRDRIERFAQAQLATVAPLDTSVLGGRAGHRMVPIENVGCYVPGGRYPLPSTALMTVTTARVAGCRRVVVATPKPAPIVIAAAAIAGADELLLLGGAHAVATLAYGAEIIDPCDIIVGPGNRWVTAAKRLVFGQVGIDMLAGPSELVLVADNESDPDRCAADLLAQAEHDEDARPILVTTSEPFAAQVNQSLAIRLETLSTAATAKTALKNGAAIIATDWSDAVRVVNRIAPEHLELHLRDADIFAEQCTHAGCIFLGTHSAEVFGDYGIGPNHTLPTGGSARFSSGLNVMTFLRWQTWLRVEHPIEQGIIADTAQLARIEGLQAHELSAMSRAEKKLNL